MTFFVLQVSGMQIHIEGLLLQYYMINDCVFKMYLWDLLFTNLPISMGKMPQSLYYAMMLHNHYIYTYLD